MDPVSSCANPVRSCGRQLEPLPKQLQGQDQWTHCPNDLCIIPCRTIELKCTSFLCLYNVNQNFVPSNLVTRSQTMYPMIPWIAYTHSISILHLLTLHTNTLHSTWSSSLETLQIRKKKLLFIPYLHNNSLGHPWDFPN